MFANDDFDILSLSYSLLTSSLLFFFLCFFQEAADAVLLCLSQSFLPALQELDEVFVTERQAHVRHIASQVGDCYRYLFDSLSDSLFKPIRFNYLPD